MRMEVSQEHARQEKDIWEFELAVMRSKKQRQDVRARAHEMRAGMQGKLFQQHTGQEPLHTTKPAIIQAK